MLKKIDRAPRSLTRITPPAEPMHFMEQLGGGNADLGRRFLSQASGVYPNPKSPEQRDLYKSEVTAFLAGIAPRDVLESALSAQICNLHLYAMCLLQSSIRETNPDVAASKERRALRLIAACQRSMECLDRHRNRGRKQVVRVERVNINAGAQAIVGSVDARGRGED